MTAPEPIAAVVDHEANTVTVAITFRWDRQQLCLDKCEARGFTAAMRETLVDWLSVSGWPITGFSYQCFEPDEESQLGTLADLAHPVCGGCGKPAVPLDYAPWFGHADVNDTLSCSHFADDVSPVVTFPNLLDVELSDS
jgi:hypothetical protein